MMEHSLFKRGKVHGIAVRTVLDVDPQFLDDIIVTAVEGGIGYWSQVEEYRHANQAPGHVFASIIDISDDYDEEETEDSTTELPPRYRIDSETIYRALTLVAAAGATELEALRIGKFSQDDIIHAMMEKDAGEIDAGLADDLVQIGLFGRTMYG